MTRWTTKRPGDPLGGILVDDECPDLSGGVDMLYYDRPDWIRLPPELGGGKRRLLSVERATCPCGEHTSVRRFNLDGGDHLVVFECPSEGFLWCHLKDNMEGT
jgi:hypothetical protein